MKRKYNCENGYAVSSSSNLRISWKRLKKAAGIFRKIGRPAGW
jgi:hypothetical protein